MGLGEGGGRGILQSFTVPSNRAGDTKIQQNIESLAVYGKIPNFSTAEKLTSLGRIYWNSTTQTG
jgi:hypothetical protein